MCKLKFAGVAGIAFCCAAFGLSGGLSAPPGAAARAVVEAKSATIAVPKAAFALNAAEDPAFAARSLPPPSAEAIFNNKQQRLRDHLITVPLSRPAGVLAMPAPRADTASSVATLLADPASSSLEFVVNRAMTSLETHQDTSTVCEPSVAVRGKEILLTGNWFAAFSKDSGANFQYLNPASTFPASPQGPFCCDQIGLYDPSNDALFWLLQYVKNGTGNTLRLAVAKGDDIPNERWHYYDFSPESVGGWFKQWFDFPDLVVSGKYLYLTSNVFTTAGNSFTRSVVMRLPLEKLAAYEGFDFNYFSDETFSPRATHGARDTIYWASHKDLATMRVFTWPEGGTKIEDNDVTVDTWSNDTRVAPGPDGRDWLDRADYRITAAWVSDNTLGFAWSASQDANFRFPHVRVALIDKNTKAVQAQPHLWSRDFAFAYPAAAPNSQGRVGISLHYGGGTLFPSHAVGTLLATMGAFKWDLLSAATGRFGPADNRWGDYLAVRPHGKLPRTWVATGYTLQTGPLRTDVQLRYIHYRLK